MKFTLTNIQKYYVCTALVKSGFPFFLQKSMEDLAVPAISVSLFFLVSIFQNRLFFSVSAVKRHINVFLLRVQMLPTVSHPFFDQEEPTLKTVLCD